MRGCCATACTRARTPCRPLVQVTVLDDTQSGEHKVKIIGVITSEVQGRHDVTTGVTLGAGFGGGEAFFAG